MGVLVDEAGRLSRSRLWRLQRRFFEDAGPDAWSRAVVPHWITSNPFIAARYARLVLAYLDDQRDAIDAREPVYVVELGAGSGRFAFHFLQRFGELCARAGGAAPRLVYVMSDLAEANLAAWRAHPSLRPFLERGQLDLVRFDGERDEALQLERSGRMLDGRAPLNPLIAIANYYFDGVPQDIFLVGRGELREAPVALRSSREEEPDRDDVRLLARVTLDYAPGERVAAPYADPDFDRILDGYRQRLCGAAVSFPVAALATCARLERIARGRLLLLSADKGFTDEAALDGQAPPQISEHGSFSMAVNYHAIASWFRARGGEALLPRDRASALVVAALRLGGGDATRTRLAFGDAVDGFGPDAFYALKKNFALHFDDAAVAPTLALLRLGEDDPRVLAQCLPHLTRVAASFTAPEKDEFVGAARRAWARYFHIDEEYDLAFGIGLLLLWLERHTEAIEFFHRSLELYGPDANTLYNLALACFRLGDFGGAVAWSERTLAVDAQHAQAPALQRDAAAQLAQRVLASSG